MNCRYAPGTLNTLMLSPCIATMGGVLESVTCTVKIDMPGAVGVPLMTQPALMFSPAGSAPVAMLQVCAPVPPITWSEALYARPMFPSGRVVVRMASGIPAKG